MPTADKRQRKKENARLAREAREAAVKRRRRNRTIRNAAIAVAVFVVVILILTFVSHDKKKTVAVSPTTTVPASGVTATIKTNQGNIVLSLDTKDDPKGAGRFIFLAKSGVYNGSRWHRVVKDFVIQGGAPGGDPNKSYGHPVVGELPKDHYPVGSVAAAKTQADPAGTFDSPQTLYLDEKDRELLKGKRVVIVDDVISTGSTLEAIRKVVQEAHGTTVGEAAV